MVLILTIMHNVTYVYVHVCTIYVLFSDRFVIELITAELPELRADIDGKVDSATGTTLTVSFLKWTQQDTGGLPPEQ